MEPFKCKVRRTIHGYESCTSGVDEDWVPSCKCEDNICHRNILTGCGCGEKILNFYEVKY
jgi:hypothetical protein